MQIYLINLDKDTDRLAAADAQLKGYGISYTRESACYAKELPEAERMKHVNQFRWWCVVGRKIEMGEIGCAVSHYRIMQRMVEQNILCACILEDDVEIHYNFKETIDKVEKWICYLEFFLLVRFLIQYLSVALLISIIGKICLDPSIW